MQNQLDLTLKIREEEGEQNVKYYKEKEKDKLPRPSKTNHTA